VSYWRWLASSITTMTTSVAYLFRFSHALVHTVGCNGIRVNQDNVSVKKVEAKSKDKVVT
jgi:hypothetical protein